MDNFHFIDVKPTIDRKQTASIKDAVFKRAREKAAAMTEEKSENYTSQVQNDVMEIARESIQASPMNPFSQFMENVGLQNKITEAVDKVQEQQPKTEVNKVDMAKLKEVYSRELKHNIESVSNKAFVKSVQDETMASARNQFRSETNLTASLKFLNAQAAIQLAKDSHSKINYTI